MKMNDKPILTYERHSFPQTSSPNDITQSWLNEQLEKTLDNLSIVEMKISSLNRRDSNNNTIHSGEEAGGNLEHYGYNDRGERQQQQQQQQQQHQSSSPQQLLSTLEYLSLANDYVSISSPEDDNENENDNGIDSENGNGNDHKVRQTKEERNINAAEAEVKSSLLQLVHLLEKLVLTLMNHKPPASNNKNDNNNKYANLYQGIYGRYLRIHNHLRARCILEIRKYIQGSNFPSILAPTATTSESQEESPQSPHTGEKTNGLIYNSHYMTFLIKTMIQIQTWNECIALHVSQSQSQPQYASLSESSSPPTLFNFNFNKSSIIDAIIKELMKPIVERVQYHFGFTPSSSQSSLTSTSTSPSLHEEIQKRPEKLISWICTYIQDLVHETEMIRVWDWIESIYIDVVSSTETKLSIEIGTQLDRNRNNACYSISNCTSRNSNIHSHFIHELNQLIRFVLSKHNYFSNLKRQLQQKSLNQSMSLSSPPSTSTSPDKNPTVAICRAIESVLKYDSFMIDLVEKEEQLTFAAKTLTDCVIANDHGLFHWWLECERINALHILKEQNKSKDGNNNTKKEGKRDQGMEEDQEGREEISSKSLLIVPFTELFLSILSTFQSKTSVMTEYAYKQLFIQKVEVPVCVAFMETMHEKASILRKGLLRRHAGGSSVPNTVDFKLNIQKWISVITGTRLAAHVLLKSANGPTIQSSVDQEGIRGRDQNHCLERERIGNSLLRLSDAMVEELGSTFVEDILLERTKLASYLMQCAHTLSSNKIDKHHHFNSREISPELADAHRLSQVICTACQCSKEYTYGGPLKEDIVGPDGIHILGQIPHQIIKNVVGRLEEKLLEIALDYNDMIPDLNFVGCEIFCFDISQITALFKIFHWSNVQVPFSRLDDVTKLMSLDDAKFCRLRNALLDLLGGPSHEIMHGEFFSPALIEMLAQDGTIFNEAQSMVFSQGFQYLSVYDAINIMNRRRLLSTVSEGVGNGHLNEIQGNSIQ